MRTPHSSSVGHDLAENRVPRLDGGVHEQHFLGLAEASGQLGQKLKTAQYLPIRQLQLPNQSPGEAVVSPEVIAAGDEQTFQRLALPSRSP